MSTATEVIIVYHCWIAAISGLSLTGGGEPPGHRKPLGGHLKPLGVTMIGKFSSPGVFFNHFVNTSKPILMREVLLGAEYPALKKWTDRYLREMYGSEQVVVEPAKKENRSLQHITMTLDDFLDIYKKKDVYMVQSLPDSMRGEVFVPLTLQCGGLQKVLQEAVVWFSSGGTKSVLHYDMLDNFLCVLDGTKTVILIDKVYEDLVEAEGFVKDGMYSKVNVDSVNMEKFPKLHKVPWHRAHMEKGDCLYIPYRWYHQINSFTGRNLAVNIWFSHLWWFNHTDCKHFEYFNQTEPIDKFGFASPNEEVRSSFLAPFEGQMSVSRDLFVKTVTSGGEEEIGMLFAYINKEKDENLSWEELYSFNIDEAVRKFPDVFRPANVVRKPSDTETSNASENDAETNNSGAKWKSKEVSEDKQVKKENKELGKKEKTKTSKKDEKIGVDDETIEKMKKRKGTITEKSEAKTKEKKKMAHDEF